MAPDAVIMTSSHPLTFDERAAYWPPAADSVLHADARLPREIERARPTYCRFTFHAFTITFKHRITHQGPIQNIWRTNVELCTAGGVSVRAGSERLTHALAIDCARRNEHDPLRTSVSMLFDCTDVVY